MSDATYTCVGDVRGPCGVRHRSVRTAAACTARDYAGCERQGGYSDRRLHLATGGFATVDEQREYDAYIDGDISCTGATSTSTGAVGSGTRRRPGTAGRVGCSSSRPTGRRPAGA